MCIDLLTFSAQELLIRKIQATTLFTSSLNVPPQFWRGIVLVQHAKLVRFEEDQTYSPQLHLFA